MEIVPYLFSVLLTALVIHWSRVNAARKPGTPVAGLFRYRDGLARPPARPAKPWRPAATADRRRAGDA